MLTRLLIKKFFIFAVGILITACVSKTLTQEHCNSGESTKSCELSKINEASMMKYIRCMHPSFEDFPEELSADVIADMTQKKCAPLYRAYKSDAIKYFSESRGEDIETVQQVIGLNLDIADIEERNALVERIQKKRTP